MVRWQDWKLAGYPHPNAKHVTRRVLESNVCGRAYNHTPECLEKQAVFREQLRTSTVVGTPLVLGASASPVLPGSGMRDPAGASSSSSGMEGPQSMAVEPDPTVRRGLKRASDGDPEISEICSWISDVNVNEEAHPSNSCGRVHRCGGMASFVCCARLDEFDAKKDFSRDQATGPQLTFTWVRTVKSGAPNFRLCLRPFGLQSERSKESL